MLSLKTVFNGVIIFGLTFTVTEVDKRNIDCSLEYNVGVEEIVEIASPVTQGSVVYPDHLECNIFVRLQESARYLIVREACEGNGLLSSYTSIFARRNHLLRLKFLNFKLEAGIGGRRKGNKACAFDRFKMSDNGTDRVLCGDWRDNLDRLEYVASSGTVALSFITDFSDGYPGFKIQVFVRCLMVALYDFYQRPVLDFHSFLTRFCVRNSVIKTCPVKV